MRKKRFQADLTEEEKARPYAKYFYKKPAPIPRETILDELGSVRSLCARSPFVRRLQTWPRGYPGDFETVEYIMNAENRAEPGTLDYWLEQHTLTSDIAQGCSSGQLDRTSTGVESSEERQQDQDIDSCLRRMSRSSHGPRSSFWMRLPSRFE